MTTTVTAPKPDARVIRDIQRLNCSQLAWLAKLVTYRYNDTVIFGDRKMTVAEFCQEWSAFRASAFQVKVWCGPPTKKRWTKINLAQYAVDWYFSAIANRNDPMVSGIEHFILGGEHEIRRGS